MKTCPRCDRTYPDSETFCAQDGIALVPAGPAFTQGADRGAGGAGRPPASEETKIECPVCGGKAEPGEVICNFCGARLSDSQPEAPAPAAPAATSRRAPQFSSSRLAGPTGAADEAQDEETGGGRALGIIGYTLAALVALGGGAWLALHLTSAKAPEETKAVSPSAVASPAAVPSGPQVVLATGLGIQVAGESASSPERDQEAMRKVFDANKAGLLDIYKRALGSDASMHDAMDLRLKVMPDGTVGGAAVRTSSVPNPSLDADVVKEVSGWSFTPFSGGQVEVDYPVILARDDADRASLESDLKAKLASLSPTETPEYASAPVATPASAAPSPPAAPAVGAATPAAAPSEALGAAAPSPAARAAHKRPRREYAAVPKPTPSLLERVQTALKGNRKLGRVRAYTDHGTVTLYGKVFDDNDKLLAERTARNVDGVSGVNNVLTTDLGEWAAMESKIQQQLQNAGLGKVTVKVIGHDAYLGGSVKTDLEKERAVTITVGAAPVMVRANLISVEPGRVFGF
ncbi:MAG TPA: BON domain-containing protein [Candidatus Binataceae bacterium]|nr:BON domain-containing protein [Candidatus Binataceae bacterium]